MSADRRGDHHDVHGTDGGQGLRQVGVEVCAVDARRIQNDAGVDRGDQFDQPLVRESADVGRVDLSEAADADEHQAGWSAVVAGDAALLAGDEFILGLPR